MTHEARSCVSVEDNGNTLENPMTDMFVSLDVSNKD